jgi:hypothetical protein
MSISLIDPLIQRRLAVKSTLTFLILTIAVVIVHFNTPLGGAFTLFLSVICFIGFLYNLINGKPEPSSPQ